MDIHTATEQAYKNGYADGMKEFAERLKKICDAPYWCVWLSEIDDLLEEMLKSKDLKEQTAEEVTNDKQEKSIGSGKGCCRILQRTTKLPKLYFPNIRLRELALCNRCF